MTATRWPVPRAQVFGWHALTGRQASALPCLLDTPGSAYTTSGRAAITLALEGLGIRAGDTVLLPSYHCPTMVAPASQLGATPTFYPILASGQPDLHWLERHAPPGAKALLVAHFFGLPQPMRGLRQWCDSRGMALVEDCAHALFGEVQGRPVGTWGHAAIGSLTKFLPVPLGGCVSFEGRPMALALTRSSAREDAKAALDILEDGARHGRLGIFSRLVTGSLDGLRQLRRANSPTPPAPHTEARPTALEAGFTIDMPLAHRQLPASCRAVATWLPRERIVTRRRSHYQWLAGALSKSTRLRPLMPELPDHAAPYVMPLWVEDPDPGYLNLKERGVPVFRWDRPWPNVPALPGDCGPNWAHHVIQLGCHQDLTEEDLAWIARQVNECFGSHSSRAPARTPATPLPRAAQRQADIWPGNS